MTELIKIDTCFGKAGDIIPLQFINDCFWQFPDYNNNFPEYDPDKQPELVDYSGNPKYFTTAESFGSEYTYIPLS